MTTGFCTVLYEYDYREPMRVCGRPVDDGSDVCYDCGEEKEDV